MFGSFILMIYLCIVFFIILDLRLTKAGARRSSFFYAYTLFKYYNKNSPTTSQWQRNENYKIFITLNPRGV